MTETIGSLDIDARFCGPPDSGNGGYVCGEMAKALSKRAAAAAAPPLETGLRVRLMKPPPLEEALDLRPTESGLGLFGHASDAPLAEAFVDALEMDVPEAVSVARAEQAATGFRGFKEHVFPGCFVCGPEREPGDGLRVFPGELEEGSGRFAASWVPDASLADPERPDEVDPTFVWAALDCPGCFSFPQPANAILLLGELSAAIHLPAKVGAPHALQSWAIEHKGRKHVTGSVLYDAEGVCLARARGIWIELPAA